MRIDACRTFAVLAVTLGLACRPEPPADLHLALRQKFLGGTIEVLVENRRLSVTVKQRNAPMEKRDIPISEADSAELRRLFWLAWKHQPEPRKTSRISGDVWMEYSWQGPERSWSVSLLGALTPEERMAFTRINTLLPAPDRFPVDFGFFRRSTEDS